MSHLLIMDCGHTRTKFHSYTSKGIERVAIDNSPFKWPNALKASNYQEILIMGTNQPMCIRWLSHIKQSDGPTPMVLGKDIRVPVVQKSGPGTGNDRLVHALGAGQKHPGHEVVVVSAGSAFVVDYINPKGEMMGGLIGMGWATYQDAMQKLNPNLVAMKDAVSFPGFNTEHAVALGWKAKVKALLESFKASYPNVKWILTGGDAEMLREWCPEAEIDPYLGVDELAKALGYQLN